MTIVLLYIKEGKSLSSPRIMNSENKTYDRILHCFHFVIMSLLDHTLLYLMTKVNVIVLKKYMSIIFPLTSTLSPQGEVLVCYKYFGIYIRNYFSIFVIFSSPVLLTTPLPMYMKEFLRCRK